MDKVNERITRAKYQRKTGVEQGLGKSGKRVLTPLLRFVALCCSLFSLLLGKTGSESNCSKYWRIFLSDPSFLSFLG